MRFGVSLVSGVLAILAVALLIHLFPGIGFVWLDEAIFVGYILSGQAALAPVAAILPLTLVGVGSALAAFRWAQGRSGAAVFWRGVGTSLVLYALAVSISNPFLGMFRSHMGAGIPEALERLLTTPGWISIVESLWGHLLFGAILGVFLWLDAWISRESHVHETEA